MYKVNFKGNLSKLYIISEPAFDWEADGQLTVNGNVGALNVDSGGSYIDQTLNNSDTVVLLTSDGYTYTFTPIGFFVNRLDDNPSIGLGYTDAALSVDATVNKGLSFDFTITNGKFDLIGGNKKVQRNVLFLSAFFSWFRVYLPDFAPNIFPFIQKPVSTLQSFRTLLLGKITEAFEKYVPTCKIKGVTTTYTATERKTYGVTVTYETKYPSVVKDTVTRIIQI